MKIRWHVPTEKKEPQAPALPRYIRRHVRAAAGDASTRRVRKVIARMNRAFTKRYP